MSDQFQFDVFLSHSAKDKAVVRELAARLKQDGVRVWLDEEQIKPGDSIPAKIEAGLEHSRVLVLCMSANAFGSDWAQLEAGTFRFRDPLTLPQVIENIWQNMDRDYHVRILAKRLLRINNDASGEARAEFAFPG